MQNLNDMYLFAKIVEYGSYRAAAEALGLQPSKLSRRINDLERGLGVRLIHRTTRRIRVTEIGCSYYPHCAALESAALAAQESIDRNSKVPRGMVRMSCPLPLMEGSISRILARFLANHPLVRVHVEMTNRRVDLLKDGLDIALRVSPLPLESSELPIRRLGESVSVVVASPGLLEQHGRPTHPSELQGFPTVDTVTTTGRHVWQFDHHKESPIAVIHTPRLITDCFDALRDAAIEGVGVARLPRRLTQRFVASGALQVILPEYRVPALVHAVFPSRRGIVPAVRALLDELANGLKTDASRE